MSSAPHLNEKTIEEMETWEIFQDVIPRGESDNVAAILRRRGVKCTGQDVRRWRNDPDVGDDEGEPIGRRNPLDVILAVIGAVGARKSGGAATIAKKIELEAAKIEADHGREEWLKDREAVKKARQKAMEFLEITAQFGDG